jgi:nucleoside-diphosphate-sugar epimerase
MATVNLLTSATELKVERLILTGSSEEPPSGDPDAIPATPYAAAKWASSTYARMFHRLYLTPVVTARIFMTYGPGQPFQKLIPYTIRSLLRGEAPKLSNAQRLIDWIYVDDVIQGLLAAAQANDLEGSTLDLGSGSLISVQEIVEQLVHIVKPEIHPSFGALPSRPVGPVRPANVIDSYTRTGWKAVTPLAKGLELTVDWYRMQSASSNPEAKLQTTASQDNPSQKHGSWKT